LLRVEVSESLGERSTVHVLQRLPGDGVFVQSHQADYQSVVVEIVDHLPVTRLRLEGFGTSCVGLRVAVWHWHPARDI